MTCHKCSRSAVGIATNGWPYCEKCVNWKIELQSYRDSKPKNAKGWPKTPHCGKDY